MGMFEKKLATVLLCGYDIPLKRNHPRLQAFAAGMILFYGGFCRLLSCQAISYPKASGKES